MKSKFGKGAFIFVVIVILLVIVMLVRKNIIRMPEFQTATDPNNEENNIKILSIEDLQRDKFYVWHDTEYTLEQDIKGYSKEGVFTMCPAGVKNWDEESYANHVLWFDSENDSTIPTIYRGDELLYISDSYVPFEGVHWERMTDYGYTIGVANLAGDNSGHYRMEYSSQDGFESYINEKSDVSVLLNYQELSNLFLDKVGGILVRDENVSDSGTVLNLEKNHKYICEWYTGTFYQDYEMTASTRAFCSLETFVTYNYNFLHSNCISIEIPEWLKTGYYYIDEVGLFRYVAEQEATLYNGESYDAAIDWNDPIILKNERGETIYDPSAGIDRREEEENKNSESITYTESDYIYQPYEEYDQSSSGNGEIYDFGAFLENNN